MCIHPCPECADVQLVHFGDGIKELLGTWAEFGVIPEQRTSMPELEVVDILVRGNKIERLE